MIFFANLTKNELFFHHLAPFLLNTFYSKLKLKIWIFFSNFFPLRFQNFQKKLKIHNFQVGELGKVSRGQYLAIFSLSEEVLALSTLKSDNLDNLVLGALRAPPPRE